MAWQVAMFIHWDATHISPPIIYRNITAAKNEARACRKLFLAEGIPYHKMPVFTYKYARSPGEPFSWIKSRAREFKNV